MTKRHSIFQNNPEIVHNILNTNTFFKNDFLNYTHNLPSYKNIFSVHT